MVDPLAWGDEGRTRAKVLHVTADFPDPFEMEKTKVIQHFVDLTKEKFAHRVISINRVGLWQKFGCSSRREAGSVGFEYGEAWKYDAPGLGILHRNRLIQLGNWIAARMASAPPDLLVAHKLTVEGVAVSHAAKILDRPYAVLIQGNTDSKILMARPDLRRHFRRIYNKAKVVVSLAPWSLDTVAAYLGHRCGPNMVIPASTELDSPIAPTIKGKHFVSLFHLRHRRVKNLYGLLQATRLLRADGIDHPLEIIGGGDQSTIAHCERMAASVGGVRFAGNSNREQVAARLNQATALVLPSRRESFGLAFIEALFAGTPIIYPAGNAVDGYFDDAPFALKVDGRDHASIAKAMRLAIKHESKLKSALREWQDSADAKRFQRSAIGREFASAIELALQG